MSDNHAQFLILRNEHKPLENSKKDQIYWDFQQIEKNKDTAFEQMENIDWEAELPIERNNFNLSLELIIIKFSRLINF